MTTIQKFHGRPGDRLDLASGSRPGSPANGRISSEGSGIIADSIAIAAPTPRYPTAPYRLVQERDDHLVDEREHGPAVSPRRVGLTVRPGGYLTILGTVTEAHFIPDHDVGAVMRDLVVLTGADLTIADVEAVARDGARVALDTHARDRMQEARDVIDALGRAGRGRVRRHDRVRRPRDDVHPARGRRAPAGEPHRIARRRRGAPVPARGRAGDAPAAGEHARPRPLGLPAAAGRSDLRAAGWRHPPGRAGAGERRRVGRPRAARPSRAAAHRARRGRGRRTGDAGDGRPPRRRPRAARPSSPRRGWRCSTARS